MKDDLERRRHLLFSHHNHKFLTPTPRQYRFQRDLAAQRAGWFKRWVDATRRFFRRLFNR